MRSILFSLTLVFFTGCLTEATTNPTDELDDVGAVAVDPGDPDLVSTDDLQPSNDERAEADRQMKLELVQQGADWQMAHDHPVRPDYTPGEPDCARAVGKPLDPRCNYRH